MSTVDQIRHRITRPMAVTSTADGRDHLLSQQATTAGLVAGHGKYTALCGRLVVAAALVTPPGPTCLDCDTALHRSTTTSTTITPPPRRTAGAAAAPTLPARRLADHDRG